jgi:hypothetical protein
MATVGTCPVCERAIRVRAGKMVHHGYERPGRGHIVGDCYGVARAPYEVSSEGTRAYRGDVVAPRLAHEEAFLARLEGNQVEELRYEEAVPVPTTADRSRFARSDPGWTMTMVSVRRDETNSHRQYVWKGVYGARLAETRSEVAWFRRELERCDRLIRDWHPGELREVPPETPKTPGRRRRRLFFSRRG